jgi:plasmid stability protein
MGKAKACRGNGPKSKDADLNIRLDPELKRQLQTKAYRHDWSVAAVARILLRRWLQDDTISSADMEFEKKRAPFKVPRKRTAKRTTPRVPAND